MLKRFRNSSWVQVAQPVTFSEPNKANNSLIFEQHLQCRFSAVFQLFGIHIWQHKLCQLSRAQIWFQGAWFLMEPQYLIQFGRVNETRSRASLYLKTQTREPQISDWNKQRNAQFNNMTGPRRGVRFNRFNRARQCQIRQAYDLKTLYHRWLSLKQTNHVLVQTPTV